MAAGSIGFNQALNNVFKLQHFNSVKGKGGGGRYKVRKYEIMIEDDRWNIRDR